MNGSTERIFRVRNRTFPLNGRTLVMGIVNVTPDSFSDGGEAYELDSAVERAERMIADGADIIDIGGESTRPGSETVSLETELRRVIPVIEALAKRTTATISIDTYKAEVAKRALEAGAHIVNDISAGTFDDTMPDIVAHYNAGVILMHIKGTPRDMQKNPIYDDLIGEIKRYLTEAVARFESAGVNPDRILVDPGIGFGKTLDHNLELIRRLDEFRGLGAGILLGVSRKSFIGLLTNRPVKERLSGTMAAVVAGVMAGAGVVRVHDVVETVDALKVIDAITRVRR